MAWADINGIRMYYEAHGEGQALIFAHGSGGNHLSWWQEVPHFRTKYRCVTFDHRGYGRSEDVPGGPGRAAHAEDLRALMDHLGIDQACLVAQSMGGATCLGFTMAYPRRVRALVMADTVGTMQDQGLDERRSAARLRRDEIAPTVTAYNPELRQRNPALAFLYDSISALNPPGSGPAGAEGVAREERYIATRERLAKLNLPVLFIVGEVDLGFPPELIRYAASLVPVAKVAEAASCGHSVYFEDAAFFNRTVSEFLDSVDRAAK